MHLLPATSSFTGSATECSRGLLFSALDTDETSLPDAQQHFSPEQITIAQVSSHAKKLYKSTYFNDISIHTILGS
jgi:hypothetical protein